MTHKQKLTRRELLRSSAVAAGTLVLTGAPGPLAYAQGSDTIRVGVVGCGGRGSGAAHNCVESSAGVQIVALADTFADRIEKLKGDFKVPEDRCFVGLDAYKKVMALDDVNLVILATPPGFRPVQLAEAIRQGKHVFMEKPVAVCPAGIKMVIEASELAEQKGLGIVAGTQRRHQNEYVETMKRVLDGAIGEIVSAQCYWNMGGLWCHKRQANESDIEWQIRNWLYFTWLSGDHICEQHVHNIDVVNWAFGDVLPETVHGIGGRQFRTGEEYGHIFDHFGVEFTYPNDVRTISTCRQIEGTAGNVSERVVGTKGWTDCYSRIEGENRWRYRGPRSDAYVQEHTDLIKSIRDGKPLNEGKRIANSTLCAIMGRESAYSRQQFKTSWFTSRCTLDLLPAADLKLSDSRPVPAVAVPGQYELPGWTQQGRRNRG
ncbi:MAG: Gfo/Idh/MocA family oxidoreductase [Sedimentisphaerales bacterium]|nr:Gfo/Idh/MocA family oxidoreductase [Sedimentisphaerales bacterium]HNY79616.1 Gfo/Idh/MocA family oxidoreductase [Sedimentisphaerales bacterium]HOC65431.1 Gfo/Idh/MocA family oxidoreductase [Sedimentisphaerales bacterium]HOH65541.1 Gfo/Idh/MocA family oxidoreductase [Sedimentisphaerales bacterium]HQA90156.1 Gfo/Idh/MocA family oxidoreductase [Sedimentisphaerales bacterium]